MWCHMFAWCFRVCVCVCVYVCVCVCVGGGGGGGGGVVSILLRNFCVFLYVDQYDREGRVM